MRDNPIQFAVVREDPEIEAALVARSSKNAKILLIGSGGCTVLTLRGRFPGLQLDVLDPNAAQIALIQQKVNALSLASARQDFGVGSEDPVSLTACGNFESLFRCFREFLFEFAAPRERFESFFSGGNDGGFVEGLLSAKYWPVAFDLFFSDSILLAMFGPAAIQHAPRSSYPKYFQNALARGLRAPAAVDNYFLHHIFLGHYLDRPASLPPYLTQDPKAPKAAVDFIQGFAHDVKDFGKYDLICLSNIFDWMAKEEVAKIAQRLTHEMRKGATVVFRQLNNAADFQKGFGQAIHFDSALGQSLFARDRSLFYSSISVGKK